MARSGHASDAELLARAVTELSSRTGLPIAFGGFARSDALEITSIVGARTPNLNGLVVQATRGLGGMALVEKRPRLAIDYKSSRAITHDYDRAVLGEGISTLFAVPIVVAGRSRGVLYGGSWSQTPVNEQIARSAFDVASELAVEMRVRDEVERRLSLTPPPSDVASLGSAAREEVREAYAELRSIAAAVDDAELRQRLAALERRLAALSHDGSAAADPFDAHLTPRETDVLACAALGATNAEIAATLSLKEVTVKSYLQAAMAKLDASTRHAAVAKARRAGILP